MKCVTRVRSSDGYVDNRFLGSNGGVGETSSWAITVTQETYGGRR